MTSESPSEDIMYVRARDEMLCRNINRACVAWNPMDAAVEMMEIGGVENIGMDVEDHCIPGPHHVL